MKNLILMLLLISCSSQWKGPFFPQSDETLPDQKICIVGDMGKNSPAQKVVARALEQEMCHEIYALGDIIYPDGISGPDDSQLIRKFYSHYRNLLWWCKKSCVNSDLA